jgi:hemolysin-activating ACP:hemolysin acyltransferase
VYFLFKNSGLFKSGDGDAKAGVAAENSEGVRGEAPQMPLDSTVNANDDASSIESTVDSASTTASLSKEELAKVQALRSKMISASFGEIVTLLMRSPHYKHYSLSDLEWLVIPALLTNQFLVVEAQMKAPLAGGQSEGATNDSIPQNENSDGALTEGAAPIVGPRIPVGLALWAKVSPEVDEKLSANLDTPVKLRPDEWRSGEINWIIDVLGDEKIMQSLYVKLKGDVFKGQTFKVRAQNKEGQRVVTEVKA